MGGLIEAAGGVVYRKTGSGEREYLVVHRPHYSDWSLAKGKLDKGETFKEAAVREVLEETGYDCKVRADLGCIGYRTTANNSKVVHYYLMRPKKGQKKNSFKPNSEVDKIRWLPISEAMARLTYSVDRSVLAAADLRLHKPPRGAVYLVRHANAHERGKWDKDDTIRPISKKGLRQAEKVARMLVSTPVTRILSSPLVRCVQSVQPLAKLLGADIESESALAEGAAPELVIKLIRQVGPESVVLCSHGDVIGAVIGMLQADGVPIHGDLSWPKGSVWILRTTDGRVVDAEFTMPT